MPAARRLVVALTLGTLPAILAPSPAVAATAVSIDDIGQSGSILTVSGQASFGNQPFVTLGTDPADLPGANLLGKDVTGFSMSTSVNGDITLRWQLDQLPPALGRGVDVSYGKAFCVTSSGVPNCWVITFIDLAGTLNSFVWGWECPDETCAISSGDHTKTWETDQYDAAAETASATIPSAELGLAPGSELQAVNPATFDGGPVFVTTPWWFLLDLTGSAPTYDATAIDASYVVPEKAVSLAIGAPGQAPEEVAYPVAATLEGNGYTGELDVSTLAPGAYTVYARAGFGEGNCGYATADVTI